MQLTVAFDRSLPVARWGPLFHVLCLEQPGITLNWKPVGFPMPGRPLLGDADVGLFIEPPAEEGSTPSRSSPARWSSSWPSAIRSPAITS